jgi:hypothetical protein
MAAIPFQAKNSYPSNDVAGTTSEVIEHVDYYSRILKLCFWTDDERAAKVMKGIHDDIDKQPNREEVLGMEVRGILGIQMMVTLPFCLPSFLNLIRS